MSIPKSLTIPSTHHSPSDHNLFSISLLLICKYVHLYHFFFFLFIFYWRITDLQNSAVFCQTSTSFLFNSMCKVCHMIFFLLWLTSLGMTISRSIHVATKGIISFFNGWEISHCIYVPHVLYPFLCQWTFRLLPCLSYCKQCCREHWGACILSDHIFLWIYAQKWDCKVIW